MMKVKESSQPAVTDGHGFRGSTSNNGKQEVEFPEGYDDEGRRYGFSNRSPKKEEKHKMKRCFSEGTTKKKGTIKLSNGQFN